jgi:hypothetical protein
LVIRNAGPAPFDWLHLGNLLADVRQLGLADIKQRRRGVLTAIYHHISKNLKAGVGYNFTDFSDEPTDLKYSTKAYSLI